MFDRQCWIEIVPTETGKTWFASTLEIVSSLLGLSLKPIAVLHDDESWQADAERLGGWEVMVRAAKPVAVMGAPRESCLSGTSNQSVCRERSKLCHSLKSKP